MVSVKSQDKTVSLIAALLCDVQTLHSEVFTPRACRLTTQKVIQRHAREGMGFLTKTLPRLAKALDKALAQQDPLDAAKLGFKPLPNSKLPRFLGELFKLVLSDDGRVLQVPCVASIRTLRQVLYLFYKYKLPSSVDQERDVIDLFIRTEREISSYDQLFSEIADLIDCHPERYADIRPFTSRRVIRNARRLLSRVFSSFNPYEIHPKHGPGVVSTKEQLWGKYDWSGVSPRVIAKYPLDAYFYASFGHLVDDLEGLAAIRIEESSAQVLLVPKDSRGPRLISCEPLTFQWIQQGLGRAIVKHVERHPLTKDNVHFTDQQPNQFGALLGSQTGAYATLDLKEASDRVTVGLVRLLFPEPLLGCLLASRSLSTQLPNGEKLVLRKFAPMGSALCFPVLALTIWSLLTASSQDTDTRESILVYGDDVIVPTAQAANAISTLESFGLLVNQDKSCTKGLFRESCGVDAFAGVNVTPVRLRTVWHHHPSPDVYTSWVAYANQLYCKRYFTTYDLIVSGLCDIYHTIPEVSMHLACPSLYEVPEQCRPKKRRTNAALQKVEYRVLDVRSHPIRHTMDGWKMLLRYFAEGTSDVPVGRIIEQDRCPTRPFPCKEEPFSVRTYTKRHSSILAWCWR